MIPFRLTESLILPLLLTELQCDLNRHMMVLAIVLCFNYLCFTAAVCEIRNCE